MRGIVRALVVNLRNSGSGKRPVGASTITQQVAKNFLLSNEVSYERKIKEALLALRIEQAYSKDKIFELYLNEIYLGLGSYGIAAASLNYFDKPVNQLTIAEAAYLAALPKAPENYNPLRHQERAIERRNWVIDRMVENGYIRADRRRDGEGEPAHGHRPPARQLSLRLGVLRRGSAPQPDRASTAAKSSTRAASRSARRSIRSCRCSPARRCTTG